MIRDCLALITVFCPKAAFGQAEIAICACIRLRPMQFQPKTILSEKSHAADGLLGNPVPLGLIAMYRSIREVVVA
jgi:hypothetical protein